MKFAAIIILFLIGSSVFSQDLPKGAIQIHPTDIKWMDAPPPLPGGSQIAVLEGNPREEGLFTIRVKLPPYYKIPAHWHPKDERVTIIEGAVYVGFGDATDTTSATKFGTASYYINPVESHHYIFTQSEGAIMQITGNGPWGITYIEEQK